MEGLKGLKGLNKKTLLHVFIGFVLLQASFLLAISANFLLAQTDDTATSDGLIIEFINIPPSPLSGDQIIYAQTNKVVASVNFEIIDNNGLYIEYPGTFVSSSDNEYYFTWPTASFTDGIYDVVAIAYDETSTADIYAYDFQVQNETTEETTATDPNIEITVSESGNRKDFQATSNMPLESIMFHFDNLSNSTNSIQMPGMPLTSDSMNWTLNLADGYLINDVDYNFYAIGSYGGNLYTSINDILISANSDSEIITPDTTDDNTTAEPLILTFIERFESPLYGNQKISISTNQEIFNCVFKIYGPRYAEFPAIKDSPTEHHFILHTENFPNGDYTIKAVAKNNIEMADIRLDIRIENIEGSPSTETQPATESYLATEVYPVTETQPADEVYPVIKTDLTTHDSFIYSETFIFELPLECRERNLLTPEECQKYMSTPFECREQNILDPEECKRFMMENFMPYECKEAGITTKEECDYLLRNTYTDFESFSVVEIAPLYTAQIEEEIPEECKKQGITSFEECKKHMMFINMPEECRQAGATNSEECDKIMFKKYGPQECIQAQIFNPEECEKFMFEKYAPDDCREAGILNPEACKKFMFEKYGGGENIPIEEFPIECRKADVKTIEECEKVMQKTYMPKECIDEGLENEQECETYLQQKHMPEECLEADAKSRQECDKIMFKKFGPPECKIAGIDDEKECEEFMFNKYAPKVNCDNVEDWQCKNFIRERHLGNIIAKQTIYNKINEKKGEIAGKSMKAEDLEIEIIREEKIVPLAEKDVGIKIIATNEGIVLDEEDNLIQAAPIALMIDSDEDGLPDDMEKRFGTDPSKADTDGDGYNDGEEIKNGHNPLGKEKFERTLAPIEKAIMENRSLGHPMTEGAEGENFFVENISNAKDAQGNLVEGYILSGKTKPNSVATLYIYSDLPIVVTVDTDQYGNWQYQLDQSLIEGEHEVYVAINDDTGKVIEKSKPLNFFIKEASAVSVKDFVSVAKASSEEPKKSEVSIYYYLLITLFMTIAGILLFLAVIISKKKNQPL